MNETSVAKKGNAPAPAPKSTYPTLAEAIQALEKNPLMANPYANGPVGETTTNAKVRLGNAKSFEVAREKMERAAQKASGVTGGYGRVPSFRDGLSEVLRKVGANSFSEEEVAISAEKFYVANNPTRKPSKDGSQIYTAALLDSLRLFGFVVVDPKDKKFRASATLLNAISQK
jgi:hypothetical protein